MKTFEMVACVSRNVAMSNFEILERYIDLL